MTRLRSKASARREGFTLVELLVVIVIIGLLASVVVTNYDKIFPQARRTKVISDLKGIETAIEVFKTSNQGRLPQTLDQLIEKDSNGLAYLKNYDTIPRDPWDHEYFYIPSPNGMAYELGSFGADGSQGGDGEGEDIDLKSMNKKK